MTTATEEITQIVPGLHVGQQMEDACKAILAEFKRLLSEIQRLKLKTGEVA